MLKRILGMSVILLLLGACGREEDVKPTSEVLTKEVVIIAGPSSNPTPPTSLITDIFESKHVYEEFDSRLKVDFKEIADKEFSSIDQKAGISIAVYTKNKIWIYAIGPSDTSRIMTADTPVLIGSTSKTFMSALILKQIDDGLYKLGDSIEFLLSGHPDYSSFDKDKINPNVTIKELLSMTSGLPDYNENQDGKNEFFKTEFWKPSDNVLLAQSSYDESGKFEYTDTNVVLLGLIAEAFGKRPLGELYNESFYKPLQVYALSLPRDVTPFNTARPYDNLSPWSSGFGNVIDAAPFSFEHYMFGQGRIRWACCGLVSTAEHLSRWGYELYSENGLAISEYSRDILLNSFSEQKVSFAGTKQYYGYLISKREYPTLKGSIIAVGHPGGGGGYSSLLRYSPELDLSVAILANSPLKYKGACKDYDTKTCIASSIFEKYEEFLTYER